MRFKTMGGRTVYGGGGVSPDIFVPRDTSHITKYLMELYGRNIIREYAMSYANNNRKTLSKQSFDSYLKGFTVSDGMLNDMNKVLANTGVKYSPQEFADSKDFIKSQLKAAIARHIWQRSVKNGLNNEFYQIIYHDDPMIETAMKSFAKAEKLEKEKRIQ